MKEDKLRKLLEDLINDSQSNYNRCILSLMSVEEYKDKKGVLIENTIKQMNNLDIAIEINKLKRGLK